jgi:hypothetical protein
MEVMVVSFGAVNDNGMSQKFPELPLNTRASSKWIQKVKKYFESIASLFAY